MKKGKKMGKNVKIKKSKDKIKKEKKNATVQPKKSEKAKDDSKSNKT